MEKVRIHKVMAAAGVGSLRACEKMVADGRVTVNGRRAEVGMPVNPVRDLIAVDGENVAYDRKMKKRYILLNKPRGYVTTASDELGRKTVFDLLSGIEERIFPVGRLDRNSEGLLLLTNDGELANKLMHPSSHVDKKYRVTVSDDVGDEKLIELAEGVMIDGQRTAPAVVRVLVKEAGRVVMELTIHEGKNRQIRKMCEAVGLTVVRLKRIAEGPIRLGMVQPGKWRDLTPAEIGALRNAAEKRERGANRVVSILPLCEEERKAAGVAAADIVFCATEGAQILGYCGAEETDGLFIVRWLDMPTTDLYLADGLVRAQLAAAAERGLLYAQVTAPITTGMTEQLYGGFDVRSPFSIAQFFEQLKNCKKIR